MILHASFEELAALAAGAKRVLTGPSGIGGGVQVAAPPQVIADIEVLQQRLDGDITVRTLAEQVRLERAVGHILTQLRDQMDRRVLETYVGDDDAVNAYFDYANVLVVYDRLRHVGAEMRAIIELLTGRTPDERSAGDVTFDD